MADKTKTVTGQKTFPTRRLLGGALLGGFMSLASVNPSASFIRTPGTSWFLLLYFSLFALVIGFVPMIIAYTRDIKNANKAYWFAFAAMCAPGGIIWLITALIMAIFGKKMGTNDIKKTTQKEVSVTNNTTTNNTIWNCVGGTFVVVVTIVVSLVQMVAIAGGFIEWTGSFFWGIVLSVILDFIPIVGTIAGIYYATTIWDWNVLLAILFFCFPLALQLLTGSLALLLIIPAAIWEYIKKIFKQN